MHTRRYLLQIRNADGVVLFSGKADWTDKERRVAFARIERLAGLPEAYNYATPALEPQPRERRLRQRSAERLPR